MRKYILMYFMLLSLTSVFADWQRAGQDIQGHIYGLYFDKNYIFAGGDSLVFISHDAGRTWQHTEIIRGKAVLASDFLRVSGIVYASTYGYGVFRSSDNGESWQPFSEGLSYWQMDVKMIIGTQDKLFIGTDGGGVYFRDLSAQSQWQQYNEGLGWNVAWTINAMCRTANGFIAGAGANGYYYLRSDGASAWEERFINERYPNISALVAYGDTVFAAASRTVFRSIDGGMTWDSSGIRPMDIRPTHLARDGRRIYCGFNRREQDFFVWYSDDGGMSWIFFDHQFFALHNFHVTGGRIWAATNDGIWYNDFRSTGAEENFTLQGFELAQNYPNPFNPSTVIKFSLPETTESELMVYDVLGNEVAQLHKGTLGKGWHYMNFNASGLPAGVYIYRLSAPGLQSVRKMVLLK
ncbi:MAG: T9SS type A sorting domain-containing protein [Bacteroidota bacterium]